MWLSRLRNKTRIFPVCLSLREAVDLPKVHLAFAPAVTPVNIRSRPSGATAAGARQQLYDVTWPYAKSALLVVSSNDHGHGINSDNDAASLLRPFNIVILECIFRGNSLVRERIAGTLSKSVAQFCCAHHIVIVLVESS